MQAAAAEPGHPRGLDASSASLADLPARVRHRVALPLHPEYRTLPMVWYIPPLSPVSDIVHAERLRDADPDRLFATIDALRIPIEYLASLFTAGQGRDRAAGATQAGGGPRHPTRRTARSRPQREADRNGERQPGRSGRPVPAARDRQVRRPLRDPEGPRRRRRRPDGSARAAVLQPGHRRRARDGRQRSPWPARRSRAGGRTGAPNCRCSARTTDDRYHKLASVLLQYPTSALFDGLDELDAYAAQTAPSRPARRSGSS